MPIGYFLHCAKCNPNLVWSCNTWYYCSWHSITSIQKYRSFTASCEKNNEATITTKYWVLIKANIQPPTTQCWYYEVDVRKLAKPNRIYNEIESGPCLVWRLKATIRQVRNGKRKQTNFYLQIPKEEKQTKFRSLISTNWMSLSRISHVKIFFEFRARDRPLRSTIVTSETKLRKIILE